MYKAAEFAKEIRTAHPGKHLVYNLSPSFNWMGKKSESKSEIKSNNNNSCFFTDASLKSFIWDLAKHGFTLQLISLAGLHSTAAATFELSKSFQKDGMLAYVQLVQAKEKELGVDVLMHQKWSGAAYVDGILGIIQSGNSTTKGLGDGNTEAG